MHALFGRPPDFTVPYPSGDLGDLEPNIGDIGNGKIDATSFFSGWRGSRRLDADTLAEPDQYYLPEAGDPAFATGFGDVDVHEVATGRGPDADLAYFTTRAGSGWLGSTAPGSRRSVGSSTRAATTSGASSWRTRFVGGRRVWPTANRDYGIYLATYTGP